MSNERADVLVVGAGIIGLSVARDCARAGLSVLVLEHRAPRRSASWAAAGILPHRRRKLAKSAHSAAIAISSEEHESLAAELLEETGVRDGYERCGELEIALSEASATALDARLRSYREEGVVVERLDERQTAELEPALNASMLHASYHLPETAQVRPPRRLRALRLSCAALGVRIDDNAQVDGLLRSGARVVGVTCGGMRLSGGVTVVAAGAWSGRLFASAPLPVRPLRGQLVLLQDARRPLQRIVTNGAEYLVPRADGEVLLGSTMEDVGFDDRTTAGAVAELISRSTALVPRLRRAHVAKTWAGLRPSTPDARPMIGWAPDHPGLLLATGHERLGVQMAPATARAVRQLVMGEPPCIDLDELRAGRFAVPRGSIPQPSAST
jgi:glycine oxidase